MLFFVFVRVAKVNSLVCDCSSWLDLQWLEMQMIVELELVFFSGYCSYYVVNIEQNRYFRWRFTTERILLLIFNSEENNDIALTISMNAYLYSPIESDYPNEIFLFLQWRLTASTYIFNFEEHNYFALQFSLNVCPYPFIENDFWTKPDTHFVLWSRMQLQRPLNIEWCFLVEETAMYLCK